MDEIYFQCKDKYGIIFKDLKKYLTSGTSIIYKYYSNKLNVTKFFDLASFTFDYDTAINNFITIILYELFIIKIYIYNV